MIQSNMIEDPPVTEVKSSTRENIIMIILLSIPILALCALKFWPEPEQYMEVTKEKPCVVVKYNGATFDICTKDLEGK